MVIPSGKLPFSYPVKLKDCPAHFFGEISYPGDSIRQEYKEDILVGYRWYDTKKVQPLFPFGYGMSYTTFEYGKLMMSAKTMNADSSIDILVKVKNTGKVIGKEIVQLYIGDEECSVFRPVKELKDFRKVQLLPNEEKEVKLQSNLKHCNSLMINSVLGWQNLENSRHTLPPLLLIFAVR